MKKRLVETGKRTISIFLKNDIMVYAGHATLGIITAIFPLTMLIISLLNMIPAYSPEDFANLVFRFLPDVPQVKALFLTMVINLRSQSSGLLASVAAVTALWSASGGVTAIQKGLKKIAPDVKNSYWDKPVALLFTVCVVLLIPAVLLFNVLGESLISLLTSFSAHFGFQDITGFLIGLIRYSGVVTAFAAVILILLFYTFLPGGKRSLKAQIPGAVLTSVLWLIFTEAFSRFVPIFWKSSVYGSLASLFLTLTWLRVMIMILFLGGAWNRAWTECKGCDSPGE